MSEFEPVPIQHPFYKITVRTADIPITTKQGRFDLMEIHGEHDILGDTLNDRVIKLSFPDLKGFTTHWYNGFFPPLIQKNEIAGHHLWDKYILDMPTRCRIKIRQWASWSDEKGKF